MTTRVHVDGFDGWTKRARARAKALTEGKAAPAFTGITFENAADMVRLLTPARLDLLATVKVRSISLKELAEHLGRDVSAVRRDVSALEKVGIVRSQQIVNPGHGRLRMISAPHSIAISAVL